MSSSIQSAAVVTISTSAAGGSASDESGPLLAELVKGLGAANVSTQVVADDQHAIETVIRAEVEKGTQLVLTTGGTGISRDDVTPEATSAVIEKEVPGISEAIRAESIRPVPTGCLTRGVAGIAGGTLVINLPGRPKAVEESFAVIAGALPHAVSQMQRSGGRDSH